MQVAKAGWVAALALLWGVALPACAPQDRRPGTWLSGERVEGPIEDWAFAAEHREILVETRTWYGIPHSVTTTFVALDGTLYVPSVYYGGGQFPDERFWNRNVVRDPRVRLKIGDRLFERRAALVTDAAERQAVFEAFARKLSFWKDLLEKPASERPTLIFLRMDPPEPDAR